MENENYAIEDKDQINGNILVIIVIVFLLLSLISFAILFICGRRKSCIIGQPAHDTIYQFQRWQTKSDGKFVHLVDTERITDSSL